MTYIDPRAADLEVERRSRLRITKDKAEADDIARQMLFSGQSTYVGSKDGLARLRARRTADSALADD